MTRLLVAVAMLLAVTCAGCSLLGLDRFDFPTAGMCDLLNARDGIDGNDPMRCYAWRDSPQGDCSFIPRDVDGDHHFSIVCADGDEPGAADDVPMSDDCDDGDPEAFPGNPELCNGIDDDCSGIVDDAFDPAPPDPAPVVQTNGGPSWLRSSTLPDVGIAISWANGATAAGFAQITQTESETDAGAELAPFAQSATAMEWDSFERNDEEPIFRGCPTATLTPSDRRRVCMFDTDCMPMEVCVPEMAPGTRRFCEEALSYPSGYPMDGSRCLHWADCDDNVFCNGDVECAPSDLAVDMRQCRVSSRFDACADEQRCDEERLGCVQRSPGGCTASTVAPSAVNDGQWLTAFVTNMACAEGSVRLGYFVDDERPTSSRYPQRQILQRGDDRRSSVFLGVDVGDEDAASHCTGWTRPSPSPSGASGVVTASLPPAGERRVPQGLVAFFAAPLCREVPRCTPGMAGCEATVGCMAGTPGATGPVDVEVIGAWLESSRTGAAMHPIAWVHATGRPDVSDPTIGSAVPTRLGVEAVGTGPAIGSFDTAAARGYVLAYAHESGIAVHVIDELADPAPACTSGGPRPCVRDDGTTDLRPASGEAGLRASEPLTVPAATSLFTSATPVGSVLMAIGTPDAASGDIPIGFAWPEAGGVALAHATLDPDAGTVTASSTITRYADAEYRAGTLSMTYVRTGIAHADGVGVGGFVAAWATPRGTWAARLDRAGASLAPGRVRLGPPTEFPRAFVEHIEERDEMDIVVREADVVRVLGHRGSDQRFVAFAGVCGSET